MSQAEARSRLAEAEAEGAERATEGTVGKGGLSPLAKPLPIDDRGSHARATGGSGGNASPPRERARGLRAPQGETNEREPREKAEQAF